MNRVQLSWANLATFDEHSQDSEQRRPGRVPCERLSCQSGKVLDISRTGARLRIRSVRQPHKGEARQLVFNAVMGESSPFPCHIAWVRRVVWARYEVGVEFGELNETQREELAEIARVHGEREWIHRPAGKAA